jgi:Protein of unknown function (DUF2924)
VASTRRNGSLNKAIKTKESRPNQGLVQESSLDCSPDQSGNGVREGGKMDSDISKQIARLPTLPRQQLLELWQKEYRKPAPEGLRREILVPFLAYRIQENAYGGLKPSFLSELRRIARSLERRLGSPSAVVRFKTKTGTRLLREWDGETHEVVATESGYEYRGQPYKSLSQIARKITGTQWSGPAFFGLRKTTSIVTKEP